MGVTVGIVGIALAVAAILWFAFGRGPFDEEGVERPTDRRRRPDPGRGHFGPAGPGAEPQR